MARFMTQKRSQSQNSLDAPILVRICAIKSDHPLWGYRRIWAYRDNQVIGKNRGYRLMKEHVLLVYKNQRLKAKRYSTRPKPRAVLPNQYWGTNMTKVKIYGWGWVYVHIVLDWYTKEIIGHYTSLSSNAGDWLEALHIAVNRGFRHKR